MSAATSLCALSASTRWSEYGRLFIAGLGGVVVRDRVELLPGIVAVHGTVPLGRRLLARSRAAARYKLVDDLIALRRRAAPAEEAV